MCTDDSYSQTENKGTCSTSYCTVGLAQRSVTEFKLMALNRVEALMAALEQPPDSIAIEADSVFFKLCSDVGCDHAEGARRDGGFLLPRSLLLEVTSTAEPWSRSGLRWCGLPSMSASLTLLTSDLVVLCQPRWSAPPRLFTPYHRVHLTDQRALLVAVGTTRSEALHAELRNALRQTIRNHLSVDRDP